MTLLAELERHEHDLLTIKRRHFFLKAFEGALQEASRDKPFLIANDLVWLTLLDSRDMLVIHLASWAKGTYAKGGFLGRLQADHLGALWLDRSRLDSAEDGQHFRDAFARLFPEAVAARRCRPNAADATNLRDRFEKAVEPLVVDRHENRAHVYERGGTGTARMLDLDAIGDTFSYVERFLNDIRLIAFNSTFSYHDVSYASGDGTASDLVDLLLFGSIDRMFAAAGAGAAGKFPWQRREELYADLHREHDRGASPGELFNDLSASFRGDR